MRRFTPTGVGTMVWRASHRVVKAVHPHGRGDNVAVRPHPRRRRGSPPRAWGQCRRDLSGTYRIRFTPTGVGTIAGRAAARYANTVHPHGRGDNATRQFDLAEWPGSPPRAWGQCVPIQRLRRGHRFTPTGVGTIWWGVPTAAAPTVHPHGRGDNFGTAEAPFLSVGSPPRAWGQCYHEISSA